MEDAEHKQKERGTCFFYRAVHLIVVDLQMLYYNVPITKALQNLYNMKFL